METLLFAVKYTKLFIIYLLWSIQIFVRHFSILKKSISSVYFMKVNIHSYLIIMACEMVNNMFLTFNWFPHPLLYSQLTKNLILGFSSQTAFFIFRKSHILCYSSDLCFWVIYSLHVLKMYSFDCSSKYLNFILTESHIDIFQGRY